MEELDDPGPYVPWRTVMESNHMMTGEAVGPKKTKLRFTCSFQHYNATQEHAEVAGQVLFGSEIRKHFEWPS